MPMSLTPIAGANGFTLTTTRSIEPDPLGLELGELVRPVAAREDARVDRVMERLDLAADRGLAVRELDDGGDLDPVGREDLASAVGGEHLDVERAQFAREIRDALAVRDR